MSALLTCWSFGWSMIDKDALKFCMLSLPNLGYFDAQVGRYMLAYGCLPLCFPIEWLLYTRRLCDLMRLHGRRFLCVTFIVITWNSSHLKRLWLPILWLSKLSHLLFSAAPSPSGAPIIYYHKTEIWQHVRAESMRVKVTWIILT